MFCFLVLRYCCCTSVFLFRDSRLKPSMHYCSSFGSCYILNSDLELMFNEEEKICAMNNNNTVHKVIPLNCSFIFRRMYLVFFPSSIFAVRSIIGGSW